MSDTRIFNVLFLCTANSARSIIAEAILRKDGAGHFHAFSAGSEPKGEINPLAIKALEGFGYPTDGLWSKSWDAFGEDGQEMDFIFTVCDNAAGQACPVWPGHPATAHWGIDDPAAVQGADFEKERAFIEAFRCLRNRIHAFTALPLSKLGALAMEKALREIGQSAGASAGARR